MTFPFIPIDSPFKIEYKIQKIELESKTFPECTTKEIEIGLINKKIFYIHRYSDRWEILVLPEMKHFSIQ